MFAVKLLFNVDCHMLGENLVSNVLLKCIFYLNFCLVYTLEKYKILSSETFLVKNVTTFQQSAAKRRKRSLAKKNKM